MNYKELDIICEDINTLMDEIIETCMESERYF